MTAQPVPTPSHRWFAAVYDLMARTDEKKMNRVRSLLGGSATGRVLEVGAGTGLNLLHYDWAKVESLDLTEPDPNMLRRAEARLATLPPDQRSRVHTHPSPAESLPFPDATFDSAVATLVFCTVADPARALAEVHRVLKPGGELKLMEHVAAPGRTGSVQRIIQPVYGWASGDCQLSRDTEAAVRGAGFTLEVIERTSLGPLWPAFVGIARRA